METFVKCLMVFLAGMLIGIMVITTPFGDKDPNDILDLKVRHNPDYEHERGCKGTFGKNNSTATITFKDRKEAERFTSLVTWEWWHCKEVTNPNRSATAAQVSAILDAKNQSYVCKGEQVVLKTSDKWIAVVLSSRNDPKLLQVVREEEVESGLISSVGRLDGDELYLVPRAALRDHDCLLAAAYQEKLPVMHPVYHAGGGTMIPTGVIRCQVTEENLPKVKQYAKEHSLALRQCEGGVLIYAAEDVFATAADIHAKLPVNSCSPTFLRKLER